MPHTSISIVDFLLIATIPGVVLILVEVLARFRKSTTAHKIMTQALVSLAFGILYVSVIDAIGVALVLISLSVILFLRGASLRTMPK